jgi:hypothetical protein
MKTKHADVLIIALLLYALIICSSLSHYKTGDTLAMAELKMENNNE